MKEKTQLHFPQIFKIQLEDIKTIIYQIYIYEMDKHIEIHSFQKITQKETKI